MRIKDGGIQRENQNTAVLFQFRGPFSSGDYGLCQQGVVVVVVGLVQRHVVTCFDTEFLFSFALDGFGIHNEFDLVLGDAHNFHVGQ